MEAIRETAISSLINGRSQELRISRVELAARCGFKNIAKGIRRLEQVSAGDFSRAYILLSNLPDALSVEPCVLEAAILATRQASQKEKKQSYRDTFRPHAIIICERSRPEPIWVAGVIGIDRILKIDFAESSVPISYLKQAIKEVANRLGRWNSPALPAFGRPQGLIINYTHDAAMEFDLEGQPLRTFDKAIQIGVSTFTLSNRPITQCELDLLIGG